MGTFTNSVLAFGFILEPNQMKKFLMNFYKLKDINGINEKNWSFILDCNKIKEDIFLKDLIEICPEMKKLRIYHDCNSKGPVLFSIKTISHTNGDIGYNRYKELSVEGMIDFKQKFEEINEKYLNKFFIKNGINNIHYNWYTFDYEWS